MGYRNPPWNKDELILTLDIYFKTDINKISTKSPEIIELSEILRTLSLNEYQPDSERYRNTNGVYKKFMNFLAIDHPGKGLTNYSKLDKEVFEEFESNRDLLSNIALKIRQAIQITPTQNPFPLKEYDSEYSEGKILYRLHKIRERDPKVVLAKKSYVKKNAGNLVCEVCGFDFSKFYGEYSKEYIECHHNKPISQMNLEAKTKLSDLSLVCSNCHRVLHISNPPITINQLKEIIKERGDL